MTARCTRCEPAKANIAKAGGTVLRWPCSHQPRLIYHSFNNIEVVWE